MTRRRLPNRRGGEVWQFECEGQRYRAQISRFDDGSIAEIFIDCARYGSHVALHASESAVLASLALQHGVPVDDIIRTVTGPIGRALATFVGPRAVAG